MEKSFIIALVFSIIIAIFALNNAAQVRVDFLFKEIEMSQALVILGSSVLGALVVAVLGSIRNYKLKRENKDLASALKKSEDSRLSLEKRLEDSIKKGSRSVDKKIAGPVVKDED